MSVTFPPAPHTLKQQLFGQKVQYICDLPLEDCLEQLQNKSERGAGFFVDSHKILITIIYENRDEYTFIIERIVGTGKSSTRICIGGALQRLDENRTVVIVDSSQSHFTETFL